MLFKKYFITYSNLYLKIDIKTLYELFFKDEFLLFF